MFGSLRRPVVNPAGVGILSLLGILLVVWSQPAAATVWRPGGLVDAVTLLPRTSTDDFARGEHQGTAVSESSNAADGGQLRLQAPLEELFLDATLDTIWTITAPLDGYDPVIADGVLDVQERDDEVFERSAIESQATFGAGTVLEMRAAIYPGSAFVNLGFTSDTVDPQQWLFFSTRGTGDSLVPVIMTSMRTATSSTVNVPTIVTLGEYHVFRIVWTAGAAEFWVDGELVDSRTGVDIDLPQHIGLYKSDDSDSPLLIDWIRVTPYDAAEGTYVSGIEDAGEAGRQWTRLSWQGEVPAGGSVAFATRTGETAAPDTSWTDWSATAADSITSPPGRYLQFQASLSTADSLLSPVIDEVQLEFSYLDLVPPSVTATQPADGAVDVPFGANVTATFDEAIDPLSLTAQSFTLAPDGGDPVAATVILDESGTIASLVPTSPLAAATLHEARLTTAITDLDGNPLAADHVWTFTTEPPDLSPPTVTATVPAAGAVGVLISRSVSADFDEAIDQATVDTASFRLTRDDGTGVAATVCYDPENRRATLDPAADLELATTYEVRLAGSVSDLAGNPLGEDLVWSFTTRVDPVVELTATSLTDFGAGELDGVAITEIDSSEAGGQLRLAARLVDCFDAPTLDPQWHATRPDGYEPVIADGLLDVQERDDEVYELSAIESYENWGPGVVLEARAMFVPGSQFIDVGFDVNTLSNPQYAWFSSGGTGGENGDQIIYARVRQFDHGTIGIETSAQYNQWHVFKIVWTHGRVDFYVDGVLEATHTDVLITQPMHAAFYKSRDSATPYYIDWIRVTPYDPANGEYLSPVFDGGPDPIAWLDLQWDGTTPPGTGVSFATRTGATAVPDSTWSEWSAVAAGDVTSPPARYAQYRAVLSTDDPLASPVIDAVHLAYGPPTDLSPPQLIARAPADGAEDVPVDATVSATFDEAIDPASLADGAFTLAVAGGEVVETTLSYDEATFTATLTPIAALAEATVYEARVADTVRDLAGNALAGGSVWSFTTEAITVAAPDLPAVTALGASYPNPFNPATTVRFDLARSQPVRARIYGVDGRLVRTLVAGELPAGRHERVWNGRDDAGRTVAAGVYLLSLETADGVWQQKLAMVK